MISLFQTAAGAWHLPSILAVVAWFAGMAVAGFFLFLNLKVNRDDRLKAAAKEASAAAEALAASQRLSLTESQLEKAKAELTGANERVSKLEARTRPKSYKERLLDVLAAIDPKIPPAIKAGTTNFSGDLNTWQRAEIVKIAGEPGAEKFILLRLGDTVMSPDGISGKVEFTITPEVAK